MMVKNRVRDTAEPHVHERPLWDSEKNPMCVGAYVCLCVCVCHLPPPEPQVWAVFPEMCYTDRGRQMLSCRPRGDSNTCGEWLGLVILNTPCAPCM